MENFVSFFCCSVIPTALKLLIIKSWRPCRYLYVSKIHLACSGLNWDKSYETSTSAESLPSLSCLVTCSVYHMLYFSLIKLWNNDEDAVIFTTELSYLFIIIPYQSIHYNKTHLLIWIIFSLTYIFEMRKFFKKANGLFRVGPLIFGKCYVGRSKEKRT